VEVRAALNELRPHFTRAPEHEETFTGAASLVDQKFAELAETMKAHVDRGALVSVAMVRDNHGKAIMDRLRVRLADLASLEDNLLAARQADYDNARSIVYTTAGILLGTVALLFVVVSWIARREFRQKTDAAAKIADYAASLTDSVERLRHERNEITALVEAGNYLQSCNTLDEVAELSGPMLTRLFPCFRGTLYIYAASRNQLYALANWGGGTVVEHIDPGECWSLRRGATHLHLAEGSAPLCRHHHHDPKADTLCVPLLAHGEAVGLLALSHQAGAGDDNAREEIIRLADMLGHQLGLTVANIRLRNSLNEQSIRDPLTNAYNRRYLAVVADKELAQATRLGESVAIAMLDVDHFKRFNDVNGHLAGDSALAGVAGYLQTTMRDGDWLFRYGGEEFLIIMRGVSRDEALMRFDALVTGVGDLKLQFDDSVLPRVTISLGFAMFPEHPGRFEELTAMADEALYQAKKAGRNRVCIAGETMAPLPLSA
jgi:diguanylate cyclase (GGDEF)-like protein